MPESPGAGQISASNIRGRRTGGTSEIRFESRSGASVADHRVHQYLERVDTDGGIDLYISDTAPTFVDFATEAHVDDGYFYAVDSNPEQIVVKRAGRYRVSYTGSADDLSSSGFSGLGWGIYLNGTSTSELLPRAQVYTYHRLNNRGEDSASATTIIDLDADDVLRIGALKTSSGTGNATTIANGSSVLIELIHDDAWTSPFSTQVAQFDGVIEAIEISKTNSGSSGSTDFDVLLDGTSILSSLGVSIDYSEDSRSFQGFDVLDTVSFARGQRLSLAILAEETAPATGLVVVLRCRALVT